MHGTKRKTTAKKQENPKFSDMNRMIVNPKNSSLTIPRRVISSSTTQNGVVTLRAQMNGQLGSSGGLYSYTNLPFYCTLKDVNATAVFSGLTNLSARYDSYIPMRIRVKISISNVNNVPVTCYTFPTRNLTSSTSATLQTEYRAPFAKKAVIGLPSSGKPIATLIEVADLSTLFGFNVSTTHSSSFFTTIGSNPPWNFGGVHLVVLATDGISIPLVNWTATVDVTVLPVSPKMLVN